MIYTDNVTLTSEEVAMAESFHYLLERNMNGYWKWWQDKHDNCNSYHITKELTDKIMEYTQNISVNAVYSVGYYGMTIMHQLVTHNYYDAVELLLKKGIHPDIRGLEGKGDYINCYKGITPLHIACYSGNYKMAKLLLEHGADTTLYDDQERNCYHFLAGISCPIRHHNAAHSKEIAKQRLKIAKLLKCDINKKDKKGNTPLLCLVQNSASASSFFLIQHFINCGADVTATDAEGNTPLMLAAENSHITASATLMKYHNLINLQNNVGDTALHKAFYNNKRENAATAYMLMENGADCHIKNHAGKSVADYVKTLERNYYTEQVKKCIFKEPLSFEDYFEILDRFTYGWLEEKYDDYNVFVFEIARAILKKVDKEDDTESVYIKEILEKLLHAHNGCAAIQLLCQEGYPLCMPIYEHGQITTIRDICLKDIRYDLEEIIPTMQEMGVDINEPLVNGCTPAFLLVNGIWRNADVSVYERVANVLEFFSVQSMEQLNNEGQAAIHVTAQIHKNPLILERMIKKGVDVNITTDAPQVTGNTPLHLACMYNNVEAVRLLKAQGADDSITNHKGETPAYCIFEDRNYYNSKSAYKILELLDDIDTPQSETGETPMLHMLRKDYAGVKEMVVLFLHKGVGINTADHKGNTPLLIHADRQCDKDVIKLLLRAGADINARNNDGNHVLLFALQHGDCELARFLIKKGADYNIINEKGETPATIAVERGYDAVLELMTNITVFPLSDDSEADLDDYEEYEDNRDDKENNTISDQLYMAILNGYIQMYGKDKGKRLADIAIRMTEMNQNGITPDTMEEYTQLAAAFQAVVQSTNNFQTQKAEQLQREMQSYENQSKGAKNMFKDKSGMFEDFNFKLVVINSLLEKKTSFSDELTERLKKYVDNYDGEDFECIPEMVDYFETLKLTETDLAQVNNLVFDGGEEIYFMIMPDWDGESDEFDVTSIKGFEHLTNLEEVEYISMCDEDLMEEFEKAGILIM